ncbi:hypothetical protein Nepgr_001114 [Nepenthes gracilis]|uniref:EDR1/CTR1/ARMC3-like peptidase-like domain-containing protein n=1 Tax=Nepenthes gracilis TaxID=150966 RepID=A0AAD3P5H4_NEPGR|nr:hypothetical protein Nepgr_001114 [Nepenthes gracilis]
MGGLVGDTDEMMKRCRVTSNELRNSLNTVILPLGCVDVGLSRHRSLLFKVLADRINLPCMLVKGSLYTGTDDGVVHWIKIDDGSEYIIGSTSASGTLIPAEVPRSLLLDSTLGAGGFSGSSGSINKLSLVLHQVAMHRKFCLRLMRSLRLTDDLEQNVADACPPVVANPAVAPSGLLDTISIGLAMDVYGANNNIGVYGCAWLCMDGYAGGIAEIVGMRYLICTTTDTLVVATMDIGIVVRSSVHLSPVFPSIRASCTSNPTVHPYGFPSMTLMSAISAARKMFEDGTDQKSEATWGFNAASSPDPLSFNLEDNVVLKDRVMLRTRSYAL